MHRPLEMPIQQHGAHVPLAAYTWHVRINKPYSQDCLQNNKKKKKRERGRGKRLKNIKERKKE